MAAEAIKKRGGDPTVKDRPEAKDAAERALEQGLEESMAGSDPVAIVQPPKTKQDKRDEDTRTEDKAGSTNSDNRGT